MRTSGSAPATAAQRSIGWLASRLTSRRVRERSCAWGSQPAPKASVIRVRPQMSRFREPARALPQLYRVRSPSGRRWTARGSTSRARGPTPTPVPAPTRARASAPARTLSRPRRGPRSATSSWSASRTMARLRPARNCPPRRSTLVVDVAPPPQPAFKNLAISVPSVDVETASSVADEDFNLYVHQLQFVYKLRAVHIFWWSRIFNMCIINMCIRRRCIP